MVSCLIIQLLNLLSSTAWHYYFRHNSTTTSVEQLFYKNTSPLWQLGLHSFIKVDESGHLDFKHGGTRHCRICNKTQYSIRTFSTLPVQSDCFEKLEWCNGISCRICRKSFAFRSLWKSHVFSLCRLDLIVEKTKQ